MESTPTSRRTAIGLGIVSTAQLMLVLDATVVNVALPGIQDDLGFSPAGLSWVLNAYALAFGGLLLLGGRIGDTIGRLRAFEIGLATFVVASLLGGIAGTPELLVAARTLQGVGAALAAPSVLALITTTARTTHERNRGLALFSAVSSAGASLGLILGGILTDWGSWRWTLFVNVPIGIAVIVSARRFVAETPRQRSRFDVAGALTATLGSLALVSGFISAAERGWGSPLTYGRLAAGVLLIAVFLLVEARTPAPLLPLTLLRDRGRGGALLTMALVVGGQFALFFLLVQYLQRVLDLGPLTAGAAFLPLTAAIFAVSRVAPRLVERFGVRPLLVTGSLALAASHLWLSTLDASSTYVASVLGPMVLNGLGAGLAFMPSTVAALRGVAPEHAGAASGLLQTVQQVGGSVGMAVVVTVYASYAVPGDFVPGVREALLVAAAFTVVAAAVALVTQRRTSEPRVAAPEAVGQDA